MKFEADLLRQSDLHRALEPTDGIKLCFQAAFGAEHLLADLPAAKAYFDAEMASVAPSEELLAEGISDGFCRVNLGAWKKRNLPQAWLFSLFAQTAQVEKSGGEEAFFAMLDIVAQAAAAKVLPFSEAEWKAAMEAYLAGGLRPVHHSKGYKAAENPAYRVVSADLCRLLPVLELLASLPETDQAKVVAIDGRAASGKTTTGKALAETIGGGLVSMDDFFLPEDLRTEARLTQPGGNIHHERFAAEVLPNLTAENGFAYRPFSCQTMALGAEKTILPGKFRVVEGVYSCHPALGDYMDLRIFADIDPETQQNRLLSREGEAGLAVFAKRWLPLEEAYFSAFDIRGEADFVLDTTLQKDCK